MPRTPPTPTTTPTVSAPPAPSRQSGPADPCVRRALLVVVLVSISLVLSACETRDPYAFDRADVERRLGATALQLRQPEATDQLPGDTPSPAEIGDPLPDADGTLAVSVEQAVLSALRYNRALSVQQLGPVLAGTFEALERSAFDPRLIGEASYSREDGVVVSPAIGQAFRLESESSTVRGGLAQRLPTGTDLELDLRHNRTATDLTSGQQDVRAGLTVTQALLRGFGRQVGLAGIRQAELDTDISEYELRGFAESLVAEVETTYWNYGLARQQVAIFERSLDLAEQQLEDTQARVDIGVLPQTELASGRAEVARRHQELIAAQNAANRLRIELLRLMNLPAADTGWDVDVTIPEQPPAVGPPLDALDDHITLGLRLRPDLNEARLRMQRQSLEVVRTRNGLLPRLDLFVSLGKTGFAGSFGNTVQNIDEPTYDFTAGVNVEYPLGNRGPEAAHRAASIGRYQAALAIENLAQLVDADIRQAYLDVASAAEQVTATEATRVLQEEVVRIETERFRAGSSTSFLVAQAQRDLLAAEIDEVGAAIEYRLSLVDLYRVEGSLLERRALRAPGRPDAATTDDSD